MRLIYGEKHHTLKEVAEILSISTTTAQNYVKNGTLKGVKIGGLWHIKESVIKTYLNGGTDTAQLDNNKIE